LEDRPVEWVNGVGDLDVDIMSDTLSTCILAGEQAVVYVIDVGDDCVVVTKMFSSVELCPCDHDCNWWNCAEVVIEAKLGMPP
jgi:hypothetical protein